MDTDRDWLERAKGGDDAAFGLLMRRYLQMVFSFTLRVSGSREIAEDATQETFFKAWQNLKRFDSTKPLRPWLLAIARNNVFDLLRKHSPASFTSLENEEGDSIEESLPNPEPLSDELFERKELAGEVTRAVAGLGPRDRAILTLRYEQGLTFEEIALAMDAPPNTVKSWHQRAITKLRETLTIHHAPKPNV